MPSPSRYYSSTAAKTTLSSAIDSATASISLAAASGLPSQYPFTLILEKDTANEEIVTVTALVGTAYTVTRGVDGSTAKSHSIGAIVEHGVSARDFTESRAHEVASTAHNVTGDVVGTGGAQTLTSKTLTSPAINGGTITTATHAGGTLSGTFTSTATITGGTITSATITGLSSAGMVDSSATPKNYVDNILGSATAASTSAASAATSATSAATSASSASASASAAATSAASALTRQTAAATSATSALASQTAAATSAASALTSQTAAATSASSAATSATSAANSATTAAASVATITTSAAQAATSATSAATSATSAATSATSAAASATTASNSAATATTSASQAATSASSAATSASSAATSASSAATSATSAAASATAAASAGASATAAATSATSAAASATAAATSATSAAVSATEAAGYVVPSQTGNAGKFLGTDGTAVSWTNTVGGSTPNTGTGLISNAQVTLKSTINWNFGNLEIIRNAANTSTPRFIGFNLDGDSLTNTTIGATNSIWGIYDSAPTTGSLSSTLNAVMGYGAYAGHRWYTNGTERMRIDSAGNVGIGVTPTAGRAFEVRKNLTGGTSAWGIMGGGAVQSDVTVSANAIGTNISTVASAFTLTNLIHYNTFQGTIGATSAVTNQFGFVVDAGLTGATNNYGFYSLIPAGTNRYNFVAQGTAGNYFAGRTGIGAVLTTGAMALVANTTAAEVALVVKGAASQTGDLLQVQNSAGTSLVKIDSSSNVGIGTTTPATYGKLSVAIDAAGTPKVLSLLNTRSYLANDGDGVMIAALASNGTVGTHDYGSIAFGGNANIGPAGGGATIQFYAGGASSVKTLSAKYLETNANDNILDVSLWTSGLSRLHITTSGDVGIGTTTPAAKLDVNGAVKANNVVGANLLANGAFDIWQRGVGPFTNNVVYTADRWFIYSSTGYSLAQETSVIPTGATNAVRITGSGVNNFANLQQSLEQSEVEKLAGETVTFSAYLRANATYNGGFALQINWSTTGNSQTPTWANLAQTVHVPSTTAYTRVSVTATVPTNAKGLSFMIAQTQGLASGSVYYMALAKAEIGTLATEFTRLGGSLQSDLAACQRYCVAYGKNSGDTTLANALSGMGTTTGTTSYLVGYHYPVKMRAIPTLTYSGTSNHRGAAGLIANTGAALGIGTSSQIANVEFTVASGLTANQWAMARQDSSGSGSILFEAEL